MNDNPDLEIIDVDSLQYTTLTTSAEKLDYYTKLAEAIVTVINQGCTEDQTAMLMDELTRLNALIELNKS